MITARPRGLGNKMAAFEGQEYAFGGSKERIIFWRSLSRTLGDGEDQREEGSRRSPKLGSRQKKQR